MRPPPTAYAALFLLSAALCLPAFADAQEAGTAPPPAVSPAPVPAPLFRRSSSSSKDLVIHKPMPSPDWGKVIQYREEQILPPSDKNHETLYEFLFQDARGIIRTATYHETASGDGYWEVIIWDQP